MPWLCAGPECKKQPYYAAHGERPKFCFLHKLPTHVDVRNKRCEVENCEIRPHYGYDGEAPRFCANHKAEGMHNLRSRRCKAEGCLKYASCGEPGGTPDFCTGHKRDGMTNLIGRRCFHEGCETYASYGNIGMRPRFCAKHKDPSMINLTVKKCEVDGCMTQPSFNYQGQRKARFCAKHRQDSMVDVLDRHCAQSGCDRQPIYGNPHEQMGRPLWCPSHRPESSFDVKTSRCQEPNCLKHPSYGYDSDRIRRRCRLHKLPDMVDVKSPRCETPGCKKQPCCGHLGAKARFCSEHKQDGMVNLKTRAFRCKHRAPIEASNGLGMMHPSHSSGRSVVCNRACRFAYPNEPAVYCARHKLEGMVDVLNPQCSMQDCTEIPTHGYDGEQPTFCMAHMATGMKVIVAQSPNILHWSAEARKQAAANARESSRLLHEREAGSAKCTPLPPKTDPEARRRTQEAHANAARAAAAARAMEGLSASTSPLPLPHEEFNSNITAAELALAFGSSDPAPMDDTSHGMNPTGGSVAAVASSAALASTAGEPAPAVSNNSSGGGSNFAVMGLGGVTSNGAVSGLGNIGGVMGMSVLSGYPPISNGGAAAGVATPVGGSHVGINGVSGAAGIGGNGIGPGMIPGGALGYFPVPAALSSNPFTSAYPPPPPVAASPPPVPRPHVEPQHFGQHEQSFEQHLKDHHHQQQQHYEEHRQDQPQRDLQGVAIATPAPSSLAASTIADATVTSAPVHPPVAAPSQPPENAPITARVSAPLGLDGAEEERAMISPDTEPSEPAKKRRRLHEAEGSIPSGGEASESTSVVGPGNISAPLSGVGYSSSVETPLSMSPLSASVAGPIAMTAPMLAASGSIPVTYVSGLPMAGTTSVPTEAVATGLPAATTFPTHASNAGTPPSSAPLSDAGGTSHPPQRPMLAQDPSQPQAPQPPEPQPQEPHPQGEPQQQEDQERQQKEHQQHQHQHQHQKEQEPRQDHQAQASSTEPVPSNHPPVSMGDLPGPAQAPLSSEPSLSTSSSTRPLGRSTSAAAGFASGNGWGMLVVPSAMLGQGEGPHAGPHQSISQVDEVKAAGEGKPAVPGEAAAGRAPPGAQVLELQAELVQENLPPPSLGAIVPLASSAAGGAGRGVELSPTRKMAPVASVEAASRPVSETAHPVCTSRGYCAMGTSGDRVSEKVSTHSLTQCEEGVHRLADDGSDRNASSVLLDGKRKADVAAEEAADGLEGGAACTKKGAANASDGMLLLAGAVASHSTEDTEEADADVPGYP